MNQTFSSPSASASDVTFVLGTRPEIIKLAPVISALAGRSRVIWTGQHFDYLLSDVFFEEAALPRPTEVLDGVGGRPRAVQMLTMLSGLLERFQSERPDVVVVQGDTNSANAGAQAAHYLDIPVVHVEAGLRSYDRRMPEEVNRMVVGSVADLHCCPTPANAEALRRAGVEKAAIRVTGNTIVEATTAALPDTAARLALLDHHGLYPDSYVLVTIHRPENTDERERLTRIVDGLRSSPLPVLFPAHPRTAHALRRFGIQPDARGQLRLVEPLPRRDFLALAAHARLIVSDSGGIQEEVTVLKKPLVVVRRSTERPEAFSAGFACLSSPDNLPAAMAHMLEPTLPAALAQRPSPFGDGGAAERIAAEIRELVALRRLRDHAEMPAGGSVVGAL